MSNISSNNTYTDVTFKNVDQTHETIEFSEFTDCKFTHCNFSHTAFLSCRFMDCEFEDCTMQMLQVEDTVFANVKFSQCSLMGINLVEANWRDWASKLNPLQFESCDMKYAIFFGLELKKITLKDCNATEANFSEADLTEANFTGTNLAGANFLRTNLTKANFVGATHYAINLMDNQTSGAKFALPEAVRLLHYLDIEIIDLETKRKLKEEQLDDFISK